MQAVGAATADGVAQGVPCTRVDHLVDVPVQLSPAPGSGVLAVRWFSRSGPALVGYEVALVRDDLVAGAQPEPVWQAVAAPVGCQWLESTFAGLASGGRYQVWLHARLTSPAGVYPGEEWVMVGRSSTVQVR